MTKRKPKPNGCGPALWPDEWRDTTFEDQCNQHDLDYNDDAMSRAESDRAFLARMLESADTPLKKLQAYVMFGLVRTFGWIFWKG